MTRRVLFLSVKKQWFDMIVSGEKKEEYREDKAYWKVRFSPWKFTMSNHGKRMDMEKREPYTHVVFINGRNPNVDPTVEKKIESITKGLPKEGWCPKEMLGKLCWVIKLK